MPRKSKKSRPRGLRRRAFRVVVWATGLIAAFYLSCTVSLILLRTLNPVLTGVQVQRRIEAVLSGDTTYEKRQTFVHLEQVPLHVRRAVIAAEDGSFYQHGGVDWGELIIVFREYRGSGRLRGASTISQQLVKNIFLTTHRSPRSQVARICAGASRGADPAEGPHSGTILERHRMGAGCLRSGSGGATPLWHFCFRAGPRAGREAGGLYSRSSHLETAANGQVQ